MEIYQKFPLEKMPSIFSHADALLVSLSDKIAFNMTIPGKIQTYLSTGIPILGMLNGEGANLIKEARAGFACNAGDFKGLAGLISKFIYSEKNTLNELGLNGIKYSQEEFDKKD